MLAEGQDLVDQPLPAIPVHEQPPVKIAGSVRRSPRSRAQFGRGTDARDLDQGRNSPSTETGGNELHTEFLHLTGHALRRP